VRIPAPWRAAMSECLGWWDEPSLSVFRRAIPLSFAFAACMTFLPPVMFGWWYDTNDDVFLRFIAEGVFSSDRNLNAYLVFSNLAVGEALQFLYHYFPAVVWYDTLQTAAVFVACVVSYYSIARTAPSRIVVVVSTLGVGGLLVGVAVRHQFTIIASCLTGAGIALLISQLVKPAHGRLDAAAINAIAATCIIVGSLVRFDSFVLCVLVSCPAIALAFFQDRRLRSWLSPAVTLALAAAVAVACYGIDKKIYHDNAEWAQFAPQNRARTNLTEYLQLDNGKIPNKVLRQMKATGLSSNDRDIVANFFFSNTKILGPEKLIAADVATADARKASSTLRRSLVVALSQLIIDWPYYSLAFLLVGLASLSWRGVGFSFALFVTALSSAMLIVILFKALPFRVSHGLFYTASLAAWIAVACKRKAPMSFQGPHWSTARILTGQAFLATSLIAAIVLVRAQLIEQRDISLLYSTVGTNLVEDMKKIPAGRLVVVGSALPYEILYRPFGSLKKFDQIEFQRTGWIDQTPFQQRSLAAQGIQDLLLDNCKNDDSRFMIWGPSLRIFRRYLREHFSVTAYFAPEGPTRYFQVFKCQIY
jgi:hypothetical protein